MEIPESFLSIEFNRLFLLFVRSISQKKYVPEEIKVRRNI